MYLFLSAGVKEQGLPRYLVSAIVAEAKKRRVGGKGKFCYVPVSMFVGADRFDFVVTFFDKPVRQQHFSATKGDIAVNLRSEWNVDENPLD
jgi:hypothetical protein